MRNYLDTIAERLYVRVKPDAGVPWPEEMKLFRIYAVLLLAKGSKTTMADVHNAWVAWVSEDSPNVADAVPFEELSPPAQKEDYKIHKAIFELAKTMKA